MHAGHDDYGISISWMFWGFVMVIVGASLIWAASWITTPFKLASPDNMQHLSRQANESYQALQAKLNSIDAQEKALDEFLTLYGEDPTKWVQGKRQEYQQLRTIVTNLKSSYNADCAQYMAMWNDEWRSVVAPKDLPTKCEMLE